MTTLERKTGTPVASITKNTYEKGESLWKDAWKRLIRNRAAVIGLVIIIANILVALFADILAPYPFAEQNREARDAAPQWVMTVFPNLTPRDESFRPRDGEVVVETGQRVAEGDLLVKNIGGENGESILANMEGTVFIEGGRVNLTPVTLFEAEIPNGWNIEVNDQAAVTAGAILLSEVGSSRTVESTVDGTVYLLEDRVIVRPRNTGYVPLRNEFPVGADSLGRDLLSRIIYGARVSLLVAFIGPLVSFMVGLPFGLIAGYAGGRVDNIMMRIVDLMYAFPTLMLIILFMAFFRTSFSSYEPGTFAATLGDLDRATGGMFFIFVGVGLTSWMQLARLTRGQVLSMREREFVLAAESLGMQQRGIMWKHILPNILGPIIVAESLTIPTYIRFEAFLSFIGLGVNAPTPSWGTMISDGSRSISSFPHQALFPALALFLIMFAFNFLGDGLRDALDPRMRGVE